ncbi:MAG: DUF1573 domain-containing protein [Candidatus Aureabacteria bacterium]|nr:DUF1573 domain-containing protein [Candidatus Auribacterota bacterium]
MKKRILICAVIFFGACFPAAAEQNSSGGRLPCLSISQELWDIGTIDRGEKADHTFILANTGDAELFINKVRPSCGCIAVFELNKGRRVLPGKSTELKITFDSKGYKSSFKKYIYIESNDSDAPHKITITGTAVTVPRIIVSIEPAVWNLTSLSARKPEAFKFAIENKGGGILKIPSIDTSPGLAEASVTSVDIKPRGITTVSVNLKPEAKSGKEYISLKIDIPIR